MKFLKFLKYDIKNRKSYLISYVLILTFLLAFQVLFNVEGEALDALKFFGVVILIIMSFFMNVKKFEEIFDSKPGYMIFLPNISRRKILLSHKIIQLFQFFMMIFFSKYGFHSEEISNQEVVNFFMAFTMYFLILSSIELSITIKKVLIKSEILSRVLFVFFLLFSFGPVGLIIYNFATTMIIERKLDVN